MNNPQESPDGQQMRMSRSCIACKKEIAEGASLCPECKSYQRAWKNHLQYGPSVATLIVVIVSGIVWLAGRMRPYREDVKLIACSVPGNIVIQNNGNEDIFVTRLVLRMPGSAPRSERVNFHNIGEKVPAAGFLRRSLGAWRTKRFTVIIRRAEPAEFQELVSKERGGDPCFQAVGYADFDPELADLKTAMGPTLNTFKLGGYVEYWGRQKGSASELPFKGTGVLYHDEQCK